MPDTESKQDNDTNRQLRRALHAVKDMRAKLAASEAKAHEPIAIVGLACKFPASPDLAAFWQLLVEGRDAISEVPPERWDVDALYDPDPDAPGKMSTRWGGFIDDADRFDAGFFGISPREAVSIDPQQRLLLEVAWHALEHAGLPPDGLGGSRTGVYIGMSTNDYAQMLSQGGGLGWIDSHASLGNSVAVAAGRLAYTMGLQGPAMVVDTACSSALSAVHLAVQALRSGEIPLALAAGVNLTLTPELTIGFSKARMMAADGRCKTFDARADGYVRGEGCGVVVLKRLSDALTDGDTVHALIKGSAVNQDGRSNGLTAPNGPAQEEVIRTALENAGVQAHDIGYIEAHGTGTELGDPIEVRALRRVYGEQRQSPPALLGSVKTNLGHLEAAAGMAGLIKLVLSLRHAVIPPHLHFERLNPMIEADGFPFRIPTQAENWNEHAGRRIGAVSAFGFSGTNAHVIVEAAAPATPRADTPRACQVLAVSATNAAALEDMREQLLRELDAPETQLSDLTASITAGRAQHAYRMAVAGDDKQSLRAALVKATQTKIPRTPTLALLFTGQGCQFPGMGSGLMAEPRFRETIERCETALAPHLDRPLGELLFAADAPLERSEILQPALFSLELAIAELWRSWGLQPAMVAGHSLGEIAAACFAGAMDLEAGLAFVAARGRLIAGQTGGGGMLAAFAPAEQVAAAIEGSGAVIAAFNSPLNTVIAGNTHALAQAQASLNAAGIEQRPLDVATAFHSPVLDPCLEQLQQAAALIPEGDAELPVVSNLTGEPMLRFDADYWRRQARQPVRFAEVLRTLEAEGCNIFLEVGPRPILSALGRETLGPQATFIPSLRQGIDDARAMAEALVQLYESGAEIDWRRYQGKGWRRIEGCAYPFRRERFWPALARPRASTEVAKRNGHPLLGQRLATPIPQTVFEVFMSTDKLPFLADHEVFGEVVVPGAMHGVSALAAAGELGITPAQVEDLVFEQALVVPEQGIQVNVIVEAANGGGSDFAIHGRGHEGNWLRHASGSIALNTASPGKLELETLRTTLAPDTQGSEALFQMLAERGIKLGPAFQGMRALWRGEGEALARIELPEGLEADAARLPIHPAVLDSCFQMLGATFSGPGTSGGFLPLSIDRLLFWRTPPRNFWCHVRAESVGDGSDVAVGHFRLADDEGNALLSVEGLQIKRVSQADSTAPKRRSTRGELADACLAVDWIPAPLPLLSWSQPASLADYAKAQGTLELARLAPDDGLGDMLERMAVAYAADALDALGISAEGDAQPDTVAAGIDPKQQRLLHRVREIARQEADAARQAGETLSEAAKLRYPDNHLEIDLVARCGRGLAGVLKGQQDPLRLLFSEDAKSQGNIYGDSGLARIANHMTASVLAEALRKRGDGVPVRVLEVGAGTGATTTALLPLLHDRPGSRYVFSDISPGFVEPAREAFAGFDYVDFRLFDLEQAPGQQALQAASFDLIIAANVVHATANIRQSLSHLRSLLAPGGLLVLVESTLALNWWDIVFGLTEGWWRFTDTELRPHHPLLAGPVWEQELRQLGFSETSSVAVDDKGCQSLILAGVESTPGKYWLVHDGDQGAAFELAETLASQLAWQRIGARIMSATQAIEQVALESPSGVVYTGAVSAPDETALHQCFDLVRAMASHNREHLWLITRGACQVEGVIGSNQGSLVRGLSKVVMLEHPDLDCRQVDLDPQADSGDTELLRELLVSDGEVETAWRSGRRLASRLSQITLASGEAPRFEANGSYLIAGGCGGLGPLLAEWLVNRGAGSVILTGRRSPRPKLAERIAALPGTVLTRVADVADEAAMQAVFAEFGDNLPPLKGVFHLAGSLADGSLLGQEWEHFASILPGKVDGARILDKLTRDLPLDHFVLFSSSASLMGNLGQANHAAANAYLDATAESRRARGLPGLSINWGAWAEVGAVVDGAYDEQMRLAGARTIPPQSGLEALGLAMLDERARIGIVPVEWPRFLAGYGKRVPPFFERLVNVGVSARVAEKPAAGESAAVGDLKRLLSAVQPEQRLEQLAAFLQTQAAAVLGIGEPSSIDPQQPLSELGLDSLLALELRTRLGDALGRKQPATLLFNHPSVAALADHFAPEVMEIESTGNAGEDALMTEISELSDADLESLIDGELQRLLDE